MHVRIVKVQPTLTKVLLELGCLYLAVKMSNYGRSIVPVRKLQFPPLKQVSLKMQRYALVRICPTVRGMSAPHVVMSVIAYISTFFKLCMHIT